MAEPWEVMKWELRVKIVFSSHWTIYESTRPDKETIRPSRTPPREYASQHQSH